MARFINFELIGISHGEWNTYELGLRSERHGNTSIVAHAMEEVVLANLTDKPGGGGRERKICHEMVGDRGE